MSSKDTTYFNALYQVARVINSSLEPKKVLERIAEQVTTATGSKACNIRLLDKNKNHLLPGASYGLSDGYMRKGTVEVDKSGVDRKILAGEIIQIENACEDPGFQYPDKAKEEGFTSILMLPLQTEGDKVIGVLRIYSEKPRKFAKDEIEFAQAVASLSAIAINNARMHEALNLNYQILNEYQYQIFED
ncbi:MAG: GAF domain-containing protein [Deltaproteobacteria bacterium]|nr:GAF domain-containing protein [Deltaproteobacteria bacterium]